MVDLVVDPAVTVRAASRRRLRLAVSRMARAAARTEGRPDFEVALRLTDDAGIRALNRAYRAKDRPTDVLAFAQREGGPRASGLGPRVPELLGDVVISVPTARRQAKRGLAHELRFLAAHGLCHLLGYDHRDDAEEAEMNARMAGLLAEAMRRGRIKAA